MTNKNNKQTRMETLKNAGLDTSKFFNLNMNIPVGANVQITIDGVSYAINSSDDEIAKGIMKEGYIFNSRVDGRFVAAQTFKLLNGKAFNYETRQYEYGWDACLRLNYAYMYQFKMMQDELHRLAKMEESNDPDFERLSQFFTKDVVYQTCRHYLKQLKKYVKSQPNRKCKGESYVKLSKYGDVFVKDLNRKVYNPIEKTLEEIKNSSNYSVLKRNLNTFVWIIPKLPAKTPKCSAWKDAFKGKGAYLTLLNIIKFHNVVVQNYETKEILDTYESVAYVESLLGTYKDEYWKFHELLKATIELNNFDLRKSIEAQNGN